MAYGRDTNLRTQERIRSIQKFCPKGFRFRFVSMVLEDGL
jgi:hypothetical protein